MAAAAPQVPFLHPRLLRFFAKFPPEVYSAYATGQAIPTSKQRIATPDLKPLSATTVPKAISVPDIQPQPSTISNATSETQTVESSTPLPPQSSTNESITSPSLLKVAEELIFNPFLPRKNHATGRWRSPVYGLRQQADLFKLARDYGVEELLPPSRKSSEFKQRRALEKGLAVRGTGEGQSVKGHKWERQISVTMEKRRKAMEEMPELIRQWKQRGHGRGWKKYPR